jgi:hypothetical protein
MMTLEGFWSLINNGTNAAASESILFIPTTRALEIQLVTDLKDFNNVCPLTAYAEVLYTLCEIPWIQRI